MDQNDTILKRNYGIDLLKIISMLFVIIHHIILWGGYGLSSGQSGLKGIILAIINAFSLNAVNCFVMCSGYVMCRKEFKIVRIMKLWCVVEFYSLLVLLVAALFFPHLALDWRHWIFTLLPLTMNKYWFFTNYVGLFFLMPVLNAAINHLDRKTLSIVLIAGFVLFSLHPFLLKNDMLHVYRGYCVFWFVYLYLLSGTISAHRILDKIPPCVSLLGVIMGGIGSYLAFVVANWISPRLGMTFTPNLYDAYNSPFVLIGSVSMLLLFSNIRISESWLRKGVDFVVSGVFSVYIIHSHRVFRMMTNWNENWTSFLSSHNLFTCIAVVVLTSLAILIGCVLIDNTRCSIKKALVSFMSSGK